MTDPSRVLHAARNSIPLVIQSALLPPETEVLLEEILTVFLGELGQQDLKDHLAYCLKELTGNAKKANTKRCYFQENGWDITKLEDYEQGMVSFKKDTLADIGRYFALQEQAGLHIRITFLIRNSTLYIAVKNNVAMTPTEMARAQERIAQARTFNTMEEAFVDVLDDAEGAGLGIVILVLMLRKMGLPEKAYHLASNKTETVATLQIPMDSVQFNLVNTLADDLVQVVDSLPPFPENLRQLLRLLDEPNVAFEDLAARLSIDPALTTDLIRYINSAGQGRKTRVTNLRDAVQLVGFKGIRQMILPYGAQKLLDRFVSSQKVLWTEAQRISFLSEQLARELKLDRSERDLVQIAGLLSNLGRIVVSYLHPELEGKIEAFCHEKNLSLTRFNDLTQTINPSELGARVAEKWQFPDDLIQVLRHQSAPMGIRANLLRPACVVHLAGSLNALSQGLITVDQLQDGVLEALKIAPDRVEPLLARMAPSSPP